MNDKKDGLPIAPCVRQRQGELLVVLAQSTARLAKDLQKGPASETHAEELQAVAECLMEIDQSAAQCCMTVEEIERAVHRKMSAAAVSPSGHNSVLGTTISSSSKGAFPKSSAPLYVRVEDFRHDLNQMLTGSAKARCDLDQVTQQCRSQKEALNEALSVIALLRSESRGMGESVVAHGVTLQQEYSSRRDLENQLRVSNERVDSLFEALRASTTDSVGLREVVAGLGNQSKSDTRHLEKHVEQGHRSLEARLATLQSELSKNASVTSERFEKLEALCSTERTNFKHQLTESTEKVTRLDERQGDSTAELRGLIDEAEARCLKRLEEQGSSLTNLIAAEGRVAEQRQHRDIEGMQRLLNGVEANTRAFKNEVELSRGNDNASMDKRCREVERTLQELKSAQKKNADSLREEIEAWTKTKLDEVGLMITKRSEIANAAKVEHSEMVAGLEKKIEAELESLRYRIDTSSSEQHKCKEQWERWRGEIAASLMNLEVEKDRGWSLSIEIQGGLDVLVQRTAASLDNLGVRLQDHKNATVEGLKNLECSLEQQIKSASTTLRKAFGEDLQASDSQHQATEQALQVQAATLQNGLRALQSTFNIEKDASAQRSLQEGKRFTSMLTASTDELAKSLDVHRDEVRAERGQLGERVESLVAAHEERIQSKFATISEQVKWLSGAFERGEADATRRHEQTHSVLHSATALATVAKEEAVSATQRAAACEMATHGALSQRDVEIRSLTEGLARLRNAVAP